jgi:hypothetical protein
MRTRNDLAESFMIIFSKRTNAKAQKGELGTQWEGAKMATGIWRYSKVATQKKSEKSFRLFVIRTHLVFRHWELGRDWFLPESLQAVTDDKMTIDKRNMLTGITPLNGESSDMHFRLMTVFAGVPECFNPKLVGFCTRTFSFFCGRRSASAVLKDSKRGKAFGWMSDRRTDDL